MRRTLVQSTAFLRAARRLVKRKPEAAEQLQFVFTALADDAFHSSLRTHKLKGDLSGSWACSVGYDLRIVFKIVQVNGAEAILMQTLGTHDDVY